MEFEQLTSCSGTVCYDYSSAVCDAFSFTKKGETC